ncbi:MAG: glycoside hydrolase family 66 protein, partial [Alicyclobacillus sp.]|nr:glycoside hydrolase family 66 protein [Alicyclobacillus sp.]
MLTREVRTRTPPRRLHTAKAPGNSRAVRAAGPERTRRLAVLAALGAASAGLLGAPGPAVFAAQTGNVMAVATTDKARYVPGETVTVEVRVTNPGNSPFSGDVRLSVFHLQSRVQALSPVGVSVPAHQTRTVAIRWTPPLHDFQGYLVSGEVTGRSGGVRARCETAIDVSSNWTRFPRYGFVSEYPKLSVAALKAELEQLNAYHIDALQFYDWQWKHHVPLAGTVRQPRAEWEDIAGRTNERSTVMGLIQMGHELGMLAFNYNLLYGAWSGYASDGSGVQPAWGLYTDAKGAQPAGVPMPSGWNTSRIDVMDPANPAWQQYILGQEAKVFQTYPFDGWQVDQLGDLGLLYDAKGKPVDLEETFAPFLNRAVQTLHKEVIFNNVGGYGLVPVVRNAKESVAYVECWPSSGQVSYSDLKGVIDEVDTLSGGHKQTVLAAYLDSDLAQGYSAASPGHFNAPGVLLADAVIFASGGDHIELGDNLQMLNGPYFPNHNLAMTAALRDHLLACYNFLVAYENLLRGDLHNVNATVSLGGVPASSDGMPGTVWTFAKANGQGETLQLINLTGQRTGAWQDLSGTAPAPKLLRSLPVKVYTGSSPVSGVWMASPDEDIRPVQLSFHTGRDRNGEYVEFMVPRLEYWDICLINTS